MINTSIISLSAISNHILTKLRNAQILELTKINNSYFCWSGHKCNVVLSMNFLHMLEYSLDYCKFTNFQNLNYSFILWYASNAFLVHSNIKAIIFDNMGEFGEQRHQHYFKFVYGLLTYSL